MTSSFTPRATSCLLGAALSACATTGGTWDSGVGVTHLERPPFYAGWDLEAMFADSSRIIHLPVMFQADAGQPAWLHSSSDSAIDTLLAEMNGLLDSLGVSTPATAGRLAALMPPTDAVPPDVRFGCARESLAGDCEEDSFLGGGSHHQLEVGRPSQEWISWAAGIMNEQEAARMLVVTLEVGVYHVEAEGLLRSKVVDLGTRHRATLPRFMSTTDGLPVLQLTAALMGPDGMAIRIGAEGIQHRPTSFLVSAFGWQEIITEDDVVAARTLRREDLPGRPVVWREAMRQLVTQVTGRAAAFDD